MSDLDAGLLARRTRLLLRFYPPGYRAHRGEEILDTLLETTRPGRGWPPAREMASVIGGGLRARRAANLSQGLGASLRHVGILAAAMGLVEGPAGFLSQVGWWYRVHPYSPYVLSVEVPLLVLTSLLAVMALAATWCGRRWLVAAAVAAAVLAAVAWQSVAGESYGNIVLRSAAGSAVFALVVLLPLTKRAERPPASLLWLPCLPPALYFVAGFGAGPWLRAGGYFYFPFRISTLSSIVLLSPYDSYLSLVPVLVAVCWLVTDVRPLAAIALQFLFQRVLYSAELHRAGIWTQVAIVAGLSLALTCALLWLLRHRARTAPPATG